MGGLGLETGWWWDENPNPHSLGSRLRPHLQGGPGEGEPPSAPRRALPILAPLRARAPSLEKKGWGRVGPGLLAANKGLPSPLPARFTDLLHSCGVKEGQARRFGGAGTLPGKSGESEEVESPSLSQARAPTVRGGDWGGGGGPFWHLQAGVGGGRGAPRPIWGRGWCLGRGAEE